MAANLDSLILDLLEWIGPEHRPYADVMDAWRTSCPRLTVWEDATERGLVERRYCEEQGALVSVTALGRQFLAERGPGATSAAGPPRET